MSVGDSMSDRRVTSLACFGAAGVCVGAMVPSGRGEGGGGKEGLRGREGEGRVGRVWEEGEERKREGMGEEGERERRE